MDGLNDIQEILKQAILRTEHLVDDVAEVLNQKIVEIEENLDVFVEPVVTEIEKELDTLLEPIVTDVLAFEQAIEELASPITQRVYPLLDQQPVCSGCRHYHGRTYGEYFLVCGMHPYGAQTQSCPDWETC